MVNYNGEREISLADLLVHILLRWRMIIVWMFVGAVLLGGVSYYNSVQSVNHQKTMVENQKDREVALAELQSMLTLEQQNNVDRVLAYESFDDYYNQSVLMKLNPAEVPCSKLLYVIKSDSIENGENIKKAYEELLKTDFVQWLEKETTEFVGTQISELITVNKCSETVGEEMAVVIPEECTTLEINAVHFSAEECTILEINAVHFSAEKCIKLSACLKKYIEERATYMKEKMGNHELVYIAESTEVIMDRELLKTQNSMLTVIEQARKNAKTIKNEFTAIEQRYYSLLTSEEEMNEESVKIQTLVPSISMKYVLLGMVVFAFVYVFIVFISYIMNEKLRMSDDIVSVFGVAQLGAITKPVQKKRWLWKIDVWIYRLQNRNKRIFTGDEEVGLVISAIKIAAKKKGLSKIQCVGTAWDEKTTEIAESVKVSLAKDGITVQLIKNVLYDQESMRLLEGASGAFLLECANETLYDEVQKELELFRRQEIYCLGIVLVEA